jgi:hypothetical protein
VSAVHSLFIGASNQLGQFRAGLKVFPKLVGIRSVEGLLATSPQPE